MSKRLPPKGREPWPAFYLVTAVLAASALVSSVALDYVAARRGEPSFIFAARAGAPAEKPAKKPFDEVIAAGLASAGVAEDAVLQTRNSRGKLLFEVEMPAELYGSVGPALERALKAEGVRVVTKKRTPGDERTDVLWTLRRPAKEDAEVVFLLPAEPATVVTAAREPAAKKAAPGQVALIMDDIGNSLDVVNELVALGRHITVSVLPYSPHAAESARLAHERGLEVLLHLPLESVNNHEYAAQMEGLILAGMTEADIVRSFEASFARVPFASGTNNHMGSRFTADRNLMRTLLRPVKEKGLFFVDSRTTSKTVGADEARRMGIPSVERDVFLDADEDRGRIRGRLIELLQKARKKGRAVGICHPFPETLAVLKSSLFLLDSYNLEAVPVSRLVR